MVAHYRGHQKKLMPQRCRLGHKLLLSGLLLFHGKNCAIGQKTIAASLAAVQKYGNLI